ncbi:putative acetyltransferase [Gordonia araii NBRC 100433]|uniref:Putative acetyltransferase n=1 Tax=Gordonia araii NBRC 100433 TaxID=1073574 RepID=G7GXY9_9ACTN|nr:hypothetical protein [Gordonia araii]NNG98076.1 hypothetical protein [Gordonia araii NBRC 100433]GAB08464.1 putative acetyltransferase [Gordonia araii NBRC 100433]
MTGTPFVGDRVVVRYRLGPGAPGDWRASDGATLSDVTGVVVESGDGETPLVLTRVAPAAVADDDLVRLPADLIASVRLLPYRAVRNSEIRDIAMRAVDAAETAELLGWRARAGAGEAAEPGVPVNTAVPAAIGARLDSASVAALREWYAHRDLAPLVELPERLVTGAVAGTAFGGEFHRLVRVAPDGTESDIVTVAADDRERGRALRADGFALHHRVTYRDLGR